MSDYRRFQTFLIDRGVWVEFKEKTLKNYKGCDMTMYKYFNLISKSSKLGQYDLISCAFCVAGVVHTNHPDKTWHDLQEEWVSYLDSIKHCQEGYE